LNVTYRGQPEGNAMEMDLAERFFLGLAFIGASCLCVVFSVWMLT